MSSPLPTKNGLNPTRVQVPREDATPVKALDFLTRVIMSQRHRHPDDDESAVRERFLAGEVVRDSGEPIHADAIIAPGTFINFYRRPAPEREVPGVLNRLYEDNNLLVVDKPPFLATLPRGQHIAQTALTKARVQFEMPELSPSHRLDRLTRGVLMFTKRPAIRGAYQTMFDRREPKKTYEAITDIPVDPPAWLEVVIRQASEGTFTGDCESNTEQNSPAWPRLAPSAENQASQAQADRLYGRPWQLDFGTTDRRTPDKLTEVPNPRPWREREEPTDEAPWILHHHMVKIRGRLSTYLTNAEPNAETAITGVRCFLDEVSSPTPQLRLAWRLEPHSGRTHQLRVVMRSLGMPIVNDSLYGFLSTVALLRPDGALPSPAFVKDEDFTKPMGLIARQLSFSDPLNGEIRTFKSRL